MYQAGIVGALGIGDQHTKKWFASFSRDQIVGGVRTRDGEAMRDEGMEVKFAIGKKLEKSFHVARFGPAHIANGIVDSFLFVGRIVAARAVGTGDAEVEFLFVEKSSRNIHG